MHPFPVRSPRFVLAAALAAVAVLPAAAPATAEARQAKSPVVLKAKKGGLATQTFRSTRTVTRTIRAKRVGRRTAVFPVRRLRRAKVASARIQVRSRKRYKVRAKALQSAARRARRVKVKTTTPLATGTGTTAPKPADVVLVVTSPAPAPAPAPTLTAVPEAKPAPAAPSVPVATGALGRPDGDWRPYSDASPFNQPVAGARVAANSDAMVSEVLSRGPSDSLITVDGTGDSRSSDYSRPLYWSSASDPVYTVKCTQYGGQCPISGLQVRIPAKARWAGGTDGHLTVVDPTVNTEWSFYAVESKPEGGGELRVGWGRKCQLDGPGTKCGGGAAEFGGLAGRIRWEEFALAVQRRSGLRHALFMTVKCSRPGTFVYPATKEEAKGGCDSPNAPEMGRRFFLDMSQAEIDALPIPEWRKVVARTLATYGAYVGDQGGTSFGFQFESGQSWLSMGLANPFADFAKANTAGIAPMSGVYYYKLRDGIPWNRLRALDPAA